VRLDDELVIVGLGGNLGGDEEILARFAGAVAALEAWSTVRGSRVYRTVAVVPEDPGVLGIPEQPAYLNAALAVEAPEEMKASELIRELLAIEHALGRRRDGEVTNGPRAIDLDVLLWGARTFRFAGPPALDVPHPRAHLRAFALEPMIDLLGADTAWPKTGPTLGELRRAIVDQAIERTDYTIAGAPPAPHLLER
jgi:2-amino-4-hydroxy-6-hydroxymethyldihydropteridine diphosphokinase